MPFNKTINCRRRHRHGLTMPELLIASSIVAMMLAALGTLAVAVDSGHEYSHGRSVATQHARVAIQRITHNLNRAQANKQFPGFVVFREASGSYTFPDTLVIWRPDAPVSDPAELPLVRNLVVYCPNPDQPAELWEVTAPDDARTAPALSDTSGWASLISHFKTADGPARVVLTDLLRTASTSNGSDTRKMRGAIRFDVTLRPTEDELQSYHDGDMQWDEIAWVQGIRGPESGLRQAWCSVELQLMPSHWSAANDPGALSAIPFFASGAIYYQVTP